MLFYPAIKQLTLDLASTSFLGEGLENQSDEIQTAFVNMVAAAVGVVRVPLPFTKLRKGLMGREKIIEIFSKEVPRRRESTGEDIFTELCKATYDDGSLMSIEDVVDHMSFLLMAAHDTLTSSLSSLIYHLAINPDWQDKLREEAKTLNLGESFFYEKLDEMPLTEMAFKEAMRIYPPVPVIPRLSIKAFEFGGFKIPANTVVIISPLGTQNMDELWEQPSKFDPMRFTQENSRNRHKYAWVPFSGGAHMCLGLHFAYMQAKCFVARLLLTSRITVPEGYKTNWQILPIPKPKDRLPIKIEKIAN
jgi:cytochrome P450